MCHNGYIMARIKEEDLRLNIIVNGDKGRSEILSLNKLTMAELGKRIDATKEKHPEMRCFRVQISVPICQIIENQ